MDVDRFFLGQKVLQYLRGWHNGATAEGRRSFVEVLLEIEPAAFSAKDAKHNPHSQSRVPPVSRVKANTCALVLPPARQAHILAHKDLVLVLGELEGLGGIWLLQAKIDVHHVLLRSRLMLHQEKQSPMCDQLLTN